MCERNLTPDRISENSLAFVQELHSMEEEASGVSKSCMVTTSPLQRWTLGDVSLGKKQKYFRLFCDTGGQS